MHEGGNPRLGKFELLNVVEVDGWWHYTFSSAGQVFSAARPEMKGKMDEGRSAEGTYGGGIGLSTRKVFVLGITFATVLLAVTGYISITVPALAPAPTPPHTSLPISVALAGRAVDERTGEEVASAKIAFVASAATFTKTPAPPPPTLALGAYPPPGKSAASHNHPDGHDHRDPSASFPHVHTRSVSAASYPHAYLNGDWHSDVHSHQHAYSYIDPDSYFNSNSNSHANHHADAY